MPQGARYPSYATDYSKSNNRNLLTTEIVKNMMKKRKVYKLKM